MNINSAFPSKYLKASDFGDPATYTVKVVYVEKIGREDDQKPVCYFGESDKGLVLNKTNSNVMQGLYGAETGEWKGEKIELYATQVEFSGKMVDSIRLRTPPEPFYDDDVPDMTA
jgi:hypothetical protein